MPLLASRRSGRPSLGIFLIACCSWRASSRKAASVPSLDPATYVEPPALEYWGDGRTITEVRRKISDLTQEEFSELVTDGKVLVVEDLGKDWPMDHWTCDFFRTDKVFSEADLTQQYAAKGAGGFVSFRGSWMQKKSPSGAKDKNAPQLAPFYWGIKDVQHRDAHRSKTWKKSMLKKVREHIKLPGFMDSENLGYFNRTPEFWFAGGGAGAKAHMDTHIETTMSLQLSGTKRWRLSMMEPRLAPYLSFLYTDGDVYEIDGGWKPNFNVTLRQGEALFIPPGFVHETMNVDEGADSCTASVTFQFPFPMASRLYRRFLPRVRRTADIHEIWPKLSHWATLHGPKRKQGMEYSQAKQAALEGDAGSSFEKVDKDGDNSLNNTEVVAAFGPREAVDILGFQDLNEDGKISRQEFAEVFALWASTVNSAFMETHFLYQKYQMFDMETMNIEDLPKKIRKDMLVASKKKEAEKAVLLARRRHDEL